MVLLTTLFARRADDAQAYDEVVVPFLDRMIVEFPVARYPPDPPVPPLRDLLKDWSVVVRFGDRFERVYERRDSNKTLLVEFQGVRTAGHSAGARAIPSPIAPALSRSAEKFAPS